MPVPSNAIIQIEITTRLNNMGCACLVGESSDLPQAIIYFRRALDKAYESMLISEPGNRFYSEAPRMHAFSEQTSRGVYVYQRGEYDEGMHGYSDPISLNAEIVTTKNAAATIAFNLGQCYLRVNNDDEALKSFLHALQLGQWETECLGKSSAPGGVGLIAVLHNIGHVRYRNGQYAEAIKTYSSALDILKNFHVDRDSPVSLLELSGTLNCLGVCNFHLPKTDTTKALAYFRESLDIRQAVLGQTAVTKEIATIMNNIGRVYFFQGDHDTAMDFYSQALAMRRNLFGKDHLDVAATIYNVGQTYHNRRDLYQAMTLYKEFLDIAKKQLGYHHRDVAAMLKCMAQIKHECREVDDATKLYMEAIEVGRAAFGENHPEVASIFNKLGNLFYENNNLDLAIKIYQEGLQVERVVFENDHPNIVVTITNIAQIYKLQAKYDLALTMYSEALSIQKRSLKMSQSNISNTLSSMALIYYRTHRFTKSLEAYQEVLRIRRDTLGDVHLDVASTLNSVGLVLFKLDLHDYALQSFDECLRIRCELLGRDHRDVAVVLYNLATCHMECGNDDGAMQYYREALRVEKTALGDYHPDVVQTLVHCGQVLHGHGDLSGALDYYKEALDAHFKCGPSDVDQTTMAKIYNHQGNVYLQRGQVKESVEALSQALRHFRLAGKNDSELVVSGFNFYSLAKQHPESSPAA